MSLSILFIGTLPPHPGGSAVMNGHTVTGLAMQGHTITAVAPITPDALAHGDEFASTYREIQVVRYVVPFAAIDQRLIPDEYIRCEREEIEARLPTLISRIRPDLVFLGRENYAWIVRITHSKKIPTVLVSHHGQLPLDLLNGSVPDHLHRDDLLSCLSRMDRIFAVAAHQAENWRKARLQNVQLIKNTIDSDEFCPAPPDSFLLRALDISREETVVFHASNLKDEKRPLDIFHAATKALAIQEKLLFVIVGDGPYRSEMERMSREMGIDRHFRFTGWILRQRMPSYLNLSDIVVMASSSEGASLAVLEAQACGKLVVASNIPGIRESISDGETGVLFKLGNVEELSDKILLGTRNPVLRKSMGARARQKTISRPLDQLIAEYDAALEDLVVGSTRGHTH